MKELLSLFVLLPCLTQAQDISENWNGILLVEGMEFTLVFYMARKDLMYEAKLDSFAQKVFQMVARATKFDKATSTIEVVKLGACYQGQYGLHGIEGIFYQAGQSFPLHLNRNSIENKPLF